MSLQKTWSLAQWCLRGKSVLRGLFHDALRDVPEISGSVLDVGGVRTPEPTYISQLRFLKDVSLRVVNIDANAHPDIVADAEQLPIEDGSVKTVLCFNVLEHVKHPQKVMEEVSRVLESGGFCVLETPFLINVHAHPFDYWRFTDTALTQLAEDAKLRVTKTTVLGGGPFLTAAAIIQPFFWSWVFVPVLLGARMCDAVILRMRPQWKHRWPQGYLMICQKM